MRAAALAVALVGCASLPLRRHAASIDEPAVRDEITTVLDGLDALRHRGLLAHGATDALCAPLPAEPTHLEGDDALVGILDAGDRVSSECASAREELARAVLVRDRLEAGGDVDALDALDAAIREIEPVEHECPAHGDDALAIVAAAVRHLDALGPLRHGYVGIEGVTERCRVATLHGPVELGPPMDHGCEASVDGVMRGDVLPGARRIPPPDTTPPPPGTYDFEDDLYFAPETGPFASSPTVAVSVCVLDTLWLAQLGGRWLVGQRLHAEP